MNKTDAMQLVESGPFSFREVLFEHFEEFFQSVIEQAALTPEQQLELGAQLKASVEKRDKLGRCIAWIDSQAEMIQKEEKRLAARRHLFEKFSRAINSSLHQQMKDWGINKVEGLQWTFSLKKNPPSVAIEDENLIPAEYIDYDPKIKVQQISDDLKAGKAVPGAKLHTDRTRLEIK